ncbi:unnamed protein product, partial [marine sediment metagenome]
MKIAIALPAYDEEHNIKDSLLHVKQGIALLPEYDFKVFLVDDGSTDNTFSEVEKWHNTYRLPVILTKNPKNLGLVQTLKNMYKEILTQGFDYILRTDLDADFNQQ